MPDNSCIELDTQQEAPQTAMGLSRTLPGESAEV
jgi:hypothetical protein